MTSGQRIVIAVFGISGVGKTTLIRAATGINAERILHLQASQLIKATKQHVVSSDELRIATVDQIHSNQGDLTVEFKRQVERSTASVILFDGHSVIDNDNEVVPIAVDVIRSLAPDRLVFVKENPRIIQQRREADGQRRRPSRTEQQLADLQETALEICKGYGHALDVPLLVVGCTDIDILRALFGASLSRH